LGLPSKRNRNKKSNKKSTLRVVVEILIVLTCVEFYAYRKLSKMEYDELERIYSGVDGDAGSNGNSNQQETARLVSPEVDRKKRQVDQRNQRKKIREMNRATKEKRVDDKKKGQKFNLTIDIQGASDEEVDDRLKTADKLKHMGISGDVNLSELPLWSQIVENFNSYSNDDEPVIVGMEYCEAFREKTDKRFIGVGPAGMFSTGTNLIASLTRKNCMGPNDRVQKFALVQTPYGKHNPADARFHHQVKYPHVHDRNAILPVVAIRHPYTWMSAMCKHSYRTRWKHVKAKCHESLYLQNPILEVPYGFKKYNDTHNVTNTYKSLADMWLEWYKPYFLDEQYNQTPRLMVRHEDMVYRPEKVIKKICECVGGTNRNKNPDWEHPDGFEYEEESANQGKGHGRLGRSGLFKAVVKYGQPIQNWYEQYTGTDRTIMKETLQGEEDPELRKIFETFQYQLIDNVAEPTKAEKMRARKRAFWEQREKEAELKELREKEEKESVENASPKQSILGTPRKGGLAQLSES